MTRIYFIKMLLLICCLLLNGASASAGFVLTVTQAGNNLAFDYSGGFSGIQVLGVSVLNPPVGMRIRQGWFEVANPGSVPTFGTAYLFSGNFSGLNGAGKFFPQLNAITYLNSVSGSGSAVSFIQQDGISSGAFGAPSLFLQGGAYAASGSFTLANKTLADLGLVANTTRVWEWTQLGKQFVSGNTFTITAVPEPTSIAFVGSLALTLGIFSRRRSLT